MLSHAKENHRGHKGLGFEQQDASSSAQLEQVAFDTCQGEPDDSDMLSDEQWWQRQQARMRGTDFAAGFSLMEFYHACEQAKAASFRIFTAIYFFAGERREGDIQTWLERYCVAAGLALLMVSVDLATDSRWDLEDPQTFSLLYELGTGGWIDLTFGSPPCATVSAARFNWWNPGPRPLRHRDCFWSGLPHLSTTEKSRLEAANNLYVNWLAFAQAVVLCGGFYLHEHPEDRGYWPFPSLFATLEFLEFERICAGVSLVQSLRSRFHQCPFGGLVPKGTETSSNFIGLFEALDGVRCPGVSSNHTHLGKSSGLNEHGVFNTRRLQSYPSELCRLFAFHAFESLRYLKVRNEGPTGPLNGGGRPTPMVTA